jgi:hypothetical protein
MVPEADRRNPAGTIAPAQMTEAMHRPLPPDLIHSQGVGGLPLKVWQDHLPIFMGALVIVIVVDTLVITYLVRTMKAQAARQRLATSVTR